MQLHMQPRTCISAGAISLLVCGVLGSTTVRAWGSLDHLAMPQALNPRNCAQGRRYKRIHHKALS